VKIEIGDSIEKIIRYSGSKNGIVKLQPQAASTSQILKLELEAGACSLILIGGTKNGFSCM
jgi:hypothetical protein